MDSEPYRYQQVISDIAGQDIRQHEGSPDNVISVVRNWLKHCSWRSSVPGPEAIKQRFAAFSQVLPEYCDRQDLDRSDLQFSEYVTLVEEWLKSA